MRYQSFITLQQFKNRIQKLLPRKIDIGAIYNEEPRYYNEHKKTVDLIFQEKDKQIEEKNKIIFMLQQRIGELEAKIQTMIALPDYNKEKQQAIEEKRILEEKLAKLTSKVKEQETKTYVVLIFAIIFIIVA